MKISYQYIKESKLLVCQLKGEITFDYYSKCIHQLVAEIFFNSIEKILTDLRGINPNRLNRRLEDMVRLREEVLQNRYTNVFLVSSPLATAGSHLYQQKLKKSNINYSYCSTLEQAMRNLNLDYSEQEIEGILLNLRTVVSVD